jgi:hypothetical protein
MRAWRTTTEHSGRTPFRARAGIHNIHKNASEIHAPGCHRNKQQYIGALQHATHACKAPATQSDHVIRGAS